MAENTITKLQNELRTRVSRFLGYIRKHNPDIFEFLQKIKKQNSIAPAYLCGGTLRDFLIYRKKLFRAISILFSAILL